MSVNCSCALLLHCLTPPCALYRCVQGIDALFGMRRYHVGLLRLGCDGNNTNRVDLYLAYDNGPFFLPWTNESRSVSLFLAKDGNFSPISSQEVRYTFALCCSLARGLAIFSQDNLQFRADF